MTTDPGLILAWTRFPSARVVGKPTIVPLHYVSQDLRHVTKEKRKIFTIAGGGAGRIWNAAGPQAFWRNFGQIALHQEGELVAFVQRRGLVYTNGPGPESTENWHDLQRILRLFALAWHDPDGDGVSVFTEDQTRLEMAKAINERDTDQYLEALKARRDPAGALGKTVLEATSLGAYMVKSALDGLAQRTPMRTCDVCSTFYYLTRKDVLYCSASCRTKATQIRANLAATEGADTFAATNVPRRDKSD